jgi:hypothetical protein
MQPPQPQQQQPAPARPQRARPAPLPEPEPEAFEEAPLEEDLEPAYDEGAEGLGEYPDLEEASEAAMPEAGEEAGTEEAGDEGAPEEVGEESAEEGLPEEEEGSSPLLDVNDIEDIGPDEVSGLGTESNGEGLEELPEYIEEPAVDVDADEAFEFGSGEIAQEELPEDLEAGGEDEAALLMEEGDEDIYAHDEEGAAGEPEIGMETLPEVGLPEAGEEAADEAAAAPAGSGAAPAAGPSDEAPSPSEGGAAAAGGPSEKGELLGEKAAKLFEYLKGLSSELPAEKQDEFEESGLRDKIDSLISSLKEAEASTAKAPQGLLGLAQQRRPYDPRRSPEGRRSGDDRRRSTDRRGNNERRIREERRSGRDRRDEDNDRRTPPPTMDDIPEKIPPEVAPVRMGPDGKPLEIAGMQVSPKLARLIEIIRREKADGRS